MEDYNRYRVEKLLNGTVTHEEYYLDDGRFHKLNGPANIEYNVNGRVWLEEYYLNGKKHRINGPAETVYNPDGSIYYEQYYLFGEKIALEQFETPGFVDAFILEHS